MSSVFKFLNRLNPMPKELSPSKKYLAPIIDPKTPEPTPEEDLKPIITPTEDDPDVRKAQLEEERKARLRKGRESTRTPGYAPGATLGNKTILG